HEIALYSRKQATVTAGELDREMRAIVAEFLEGGDAGPFRFEDIDRGAPLVPELMIVVRPPAPWTGGASLWVPDGEASPARPAVTSLWAYLSIHGDRSDEVVLAELICAIALAKLWDGWIEIDSHWWNPCPNQSGEAHHAALRERLGLRRQLAR